MSIEIRPMGVSCNLRCDYCYEHELREAGAKRPAKKYNLEQIKTSVLEIWKTNREPFVLFGGEPLLMPEDDLEDLFRFGFEHCGASSIQTNASLLSDRHIKMFRQYNVSVGVSIDGPDDLNSLRHSGSANPTITKENTRRTLQAILRLCDEKMTPGIIVTLHRHNAAGKNLKKLKTWFEELDKMGVNHVRLHLVDGAKHLEEKYSLSCDEIIEALLYLHRAETGFANLRFDLFQEIKELLLGNNRNAGCVWQACDPHTTEAVLGIEPDGERSTCGRVATSDKDFAIMKYPSPELGPREAPRQVYPPDAPEKSGHTITSSTKREVVLYNKPQEEGGCQGCRFFPLCKGHCPGSAINGDFGNRSIHCEVWKYLFELLEKSLFKFAMALSR